MSVPSPILAFPHTFQPVFGKFSMWCPHPVPGPSSVRICHSALSIVKCRDMRSECWGAADAGALNWSPPRCPPFLHCPALPLLVTIAKKKAHLPPQRETTCLCSGDRRALRQQPVPFCPGTDNSVLLWFLFDVWLQPLQPTYGEGF